jgi:hypothetical protein
MKMPSSTIKTAEDCSHRSFNQYPKEILSDGPISFVSTERYPQMSNDVHTSLVRDSEKIINHRDIMSAGSSLYLTDSLSAN